jgi:16S rRNA processing protein RimM
MLGRITGPFGVRGWLKVISFTEPVEQVLDYPARKWLPHPARAAHRRRHGKGLVVRVEGIDDRDAAIALGRLEFWIERRELPALKKDEYYRADLIGFEVVNLQGERLGSVDHFLDMPANAVMVVAGVREHWLPLGADQVFRVDLERGRITVDWDPDF